MSNLSDQFNEIKERIEAIDQWKTATLSTAQVVAQEYSFDDFEKFVTALATRPLDVEAAFRLYSFIVERQTSRIPDGLRPQAANNVADIVTDRAAPCIREEIVSIFAAWGSHRSDYHQVCFQLLQHPAESTRLTALDWAPVYLQRNDYGLLLNFKLDPAFGESSMGGPFRFFLRDRALEVLEKLTGYAVSGGDCFESSPHGPIFYKTWSPFLIWWDNHKNEFKR